MLILVNGVLLGAGLFSWVERRLIGRFHNRIGPNRWGPFGSLQPLADLVKLLLKEDLTSLRLVFSSVSLSLRDKLFSVCLGLMIMARHR